MALPAVLGIIGTILGSRKQNQSQQVTQPQGYGRQRGDRETNPVYNKPVEQIGIRNAFSVGRPNIVQPGQMRQLNYYDNQQGQYGNVLRDNTVAPGQLRVFNPETDQYQNAPRMQYVGRR